MNKYVCIHGHFYQPPRENPWLEKIDLQESAYPYHDWNQKITGECYGPNTASRIIGSDGQIVDIVNNYEKMSFNFGPTLLYWLEKHYPEIYKEIINSDQKATIRFSGHGTALAQCYNHMIMPLANSRNKRTQVLWGIRDFEFRFSRNPEGMWLPETAVDLETLDIMAEFGIKFTILSPHQAKRVKRMNTEVWTNVEGGKIDIKMPYLCKLPSGRNIVIFFYSGPISKEIAFNKLLKSGEEFAKRLLGEFGTEQERAQLVHIANDGETYGHHHRFGEMALSYCQHYLEDHGLAKLTVYGEYLAQNQPIFEVEIIENTSWSCSHGMERWRNDCGCSMGVHPDWNQAWRKPLRDALDWLRDAMAAIYKKEMGNYLRDYRGAIDDYIEVILDRSQNNVENFLNKHKKRELINEEKVKALMLLESQRQAMFMYTSCGWYFDDVSGIETVQVLRHASRALQLIQQASSENLEDEFLKLLEKVPGNKKKFRNAAKIYGSLVKPKQLDILKVSADFVFTFLFKVYPKNANIYCYKINIEHPGQIEVNNCNLTVGKFKIKSHITWEESKISFAILQVDNNDIIWGVCNFTNDDDFNKMSHELKGTLLKSERKNINELFNKMVTHFGDHVYSLKQLSKTDRDAILTEIYEPALEDQSLTIEQVHEKYYPIIQLLKDDHSALSKKLASNLEFVLNTDLRRVIEAEYIDLNRFNHLIDQIKSWSVKLDDTSIGFLAGVRINALMVKLKDKPEDISLLEKLISMFSMADKIPLIYEYWNVQQIFYKIINEYYLKIKNESMADNQHALKMLELYSKLGIYLGLKIF